MKKIILIFTVLAFTCLSSECLAQKVISQTVNYGGTDYTYKAVIDNTALPVNAIKSKSELKGQKNLESNGNGQMKTHNEDDEINQKVSPKFAVAKTDVRIDGTSGSEAMVWSQASAACVAYKEGDTKANIWRVPTQRELMLMCHMQTELNAIGGADFTDFTTDYFYWSSTESDYTSDNSWVVEFEHSGVHRVLKDRKKINLRCIRDL